MEKFLRLFGNLVRFSYHCFDRVVINGYLSALARPGNLAYFFREVKQEPVITKELLRERTDRYVGWVEAHAKRQAIPIDWAPDEVRKKDALAQVFKRSAPLHAIFERSCDLGLARLTPKYLADIFGWRLTKRSKGKLQTVLDQLDFGHHVLRAYGRNTFFKQYQKFANFLRDETCSNNVTDFKDLRKALEHLPRVASTLQQVNDRFMDQQAELLNVEPDHPLLEQLAQPARIKTQRFGGIRIEQDRIIRLLEVLMDGSTQINGSSAAQLHHALLKAYQLDENAYSRNQLSYDLRKLRAHGLLERIQGRFAYRLTEKGRKTAALLVLLRNRIVRPLAGSLFERPINETFRPASKLQARYRETKKALNALMDSLKVA